MKLTILGNQGPFPGAGGATTGYLLESENAKILIDCGSGIASNLQKVISLEKLDAIILSHLHSDHMCDMTVLKYAVSLSKVRPGQTPIEKIPVYCPESPKKEFDEIDKEAFIINVIKENMKIKIKDIDFTFSNMPHSYESYAMLIESGGKRLVYSGDSEYTEKLEAISKGVDLLLSDAGFTDIISNIAKQEGMKLPHMTARENAIIAKQAGVKKLLLTHFWPYDDTKIHLEEAREVFENVEVTEIMKTYEI